MRRYAGAAMVEREMDRSAIIQYIGADTYAREARRATELAPYTGGPRRDMIYDSDIPYRILDRIWADTELSDTQKVQLIFAIYHDMPCYALLGMIYTHDYRQLPPETQRYYLQQLRAFAADPQEALAQPVIYTLAVDFFDDEQLSQEAWMAIAQDFTDRRLMQRILPISGPLAYVLKAQAYAALLADRTMHAAIFASLYASCFFEGGQIDPAPACLVLCQLAIDPQAEAYQQLLLKLQAAA